MGGFPNLSGLAFVLWQSVTHQNLLCVSSVGAASGREGKKVLIITSQPSDFSGAFKNATILHETPVSAIAPIRHLQKLNMRYL
ncbi:MULTISPECIES: hypothetical protein [unclassified Nostoc]|nr:hypothetical protein [Nostoc sp. S13]MDF5739252.1 hypothetical protein [Nostoc sp. S13]